MNSEFNKEGPSVIDNLFDKKKIAYKVFSFFLTTGTESKGEVILGGIDTKYMTSNFTFLPLISDRYWQVKLNSLQIGKNV